MTFAILVASTLLAGTHAHTIRIGDTDRSYFVHVPPGKATATRPLVVLMHGGGGGAQQAEAAYRMNEVADRNGFLVAYPNGSGGLRDDILLTWNSGNCCAYAMRHNSPDVRFIRAMVERIDRDYGVDRSRVFATGMSNGGMMAHRLGCEAADLFAAIAPVAGALNIPCKPSDAVAVMIIHGTADQHVLYNGGSGSKTRDNRVDKPVSHAMNVWRTANACAATPPASRKGNISRQTSTGCRNGADVSLITVHGGGHAWPGGVPSRREWADVPTNEISASEEIWRFFAAHPKRFVVPTD